jgi:hypothetical protein
MKNVVDPPGFEQHKGATTMVFLISLFLYLVYPSYFHCLIVAAAKLGFNEANKKLPQQSKHFLL